MDIIESIEIINGRIEFGKQKYSDIASEYIEALEQAVEALLKQEPMKPIDEETEYVCGECGTHVAYMDNHCWKCGQAIDWED